MVIILWAIGTTQDRPLPNVGQQAAYTGDTFSGFARSALMTTGVKILLGTILGFLAVAYSWIFRARKVQSERRGVED